MSCWILGIAGGTASGKTTLARALLDTLDGRALCLTHDRYYHSMPARFRETPAAWNFDAPDALETNRLVRDLARLRAGRPTRVPRYDFASHQRADEADWDVLHPAEIVIVEGILVLADARLRASMDHRIFVHAPDDVRLLRRIRRDLAHRGRRIDDVLLQYEETVRPMHLAHVAPSRAHADLVLDGTHPLDDLLAAALDAIP